MTVRMRGLSDEDRKDVKQQGNSQNTAKPDVQAVAASESAAQAQTISRRLKPQERTAG